MGCTLGGLEARLVGTARERQTLRGSDDERAIVAEAIPSGYASLSNSSSGSANATESPLPPCEGAGNAGTPVRARTHARALATVRPPGPLHVRVAVWRVAAAAAIQNRSTPSARTRPTSTLALVRAEVDQREAPSTRSIMKCRDGRGRWRRRGSEAECAGSRRANRAPSAGADACARTPPARRIRPGRHRRQEGELLDAAGDVRVAQGDASHGSNPRRAAAARAGHLADEQPEDDDAEVPESVGVATRGTCPTRSSRRALPQLVLQQHGRHAEVVPGNAEDVPPASVSFDEPPQSNQDPRRRRRSPATARTPRPPHLQPRQRRRDEPLRGSRPEEPPLARLEVVQDQAARSAAARSRPPAPSATSLRASSEPRTSGSITCRAARSVPVPGDDYDPVRRPEQVCGRRAAWTRRRDAGASRREQKIRAADPSSRAASPSRLPPTPPPPDADATKSRYPSPLHARRAVPPSPPRGRARSSLPPAKCLGSNRPATDDDDAGDAPSRPRRVVQPVPGVLAGRCVRVRVRPRGAPARRQRAHEPAPVCGPRATSATTPPPRRRRPTSSRRRRNPPCPRRVSPVRRAQHPPRGRDEDVVIRLGVHAIAAPRRSRRPPRRPPRRRRKRSARKAAFADPSLQTKCRSATTAAKPRPSSSPSSSSSSVPVLRDPGAVVYPEKRDAPSTSATTARISVE